jgi:hypothetical protein
MATPATAPQITPKQTADLQATGDFLPRWDPANAEKSLDEIHAYVIAEASNSSNWYWKAKRPKARLSQAIRFSAWILAAVGGLLPVIVSLFGDHLPAKIKPDDGLWASVFLGVAAALYGLDKAFGYSTGWARYVLAATNIRKTLEEFRMDWAELRAKVGTQLTPENVAPLLERAKKFRVDVEALVLQETKDWVTEFQSNTAQTEKDIAAQISTLKTQVDKTIQAKEATGQPGLIELNVTNADKADAGTVQVKLDGPTTVSDSIQPGSTTLAKRGLIPGAYVLHVTGKFAGKDSSVQTTVTIKPGEVAKQQVALPT